MSGILIFSEKTGLTLELASAAQYIDAGQVYTLVINNGPGADELSANGLHVFAVNSTEFVTADTASTASVVVEAAEKLGTDTILLSSDRRGKELAGRVAAALNAGCLTDVKGFEVESGQIAFVRNALGGATVATQTIKTPKSVIAVSPLAFPPQAGVGGGSVQPLEITGPAPTVRLLDTHSKAVDSIDLQTAERLVIVGQGLEKHDDLEFVDQVAKLLKAEIGCSKPVATDKKWYPEERIIGLSGKTSKPALALILGVSGQVQFTVGMREAQVVVSINNDENAFMNKISDYVLVADLNEALPELVKALA